MLYNHQEFTAILIKFSSKVCVPIPFDPDAVWGIKQAHHITGNVNGIPVRGALVAEDSRYFLALGPAWRRDCGLKVGDSADVVLMPEGPQMENMAADIVVALVAEPGAKAFFESLPTFYRKNYVRWIEDAKRPETRAARIDEMTRLLLAGQRERD